MKIPFRTLSRLWERVARNEPGEGFRRARFNPDYLHPGAFCSSLKILKLEFKKPRRKSRILLILANFDFS
jgi:hypothetical protein